MIKQMRLVDWILTVFILFVWGTVSCWLWWPYNPLEVHSIKILNPGKTVEQGGTLGYRIRWTKYTNAQGIVHRYFLNGKKHPLDVDSGVVASAPAGSDEADIFMQIPSDTPVGAGKMQFVVVYPMNPLRVVVAPVIPTYSDQFTVTERLLPRGERGRQGVQGKQGIQGIPGKNMWGK